MGFKVEGMDNLMLKFKRLSDPEGFEKAMGKACALVERAAKEKAPKSTGELRRSISSRVEKDGNNIVGVVFTPLLYAPYVEYGTGLFAEEEGRKDVPWHYQDDKGEWHTTNGMKPQPYLRPALDENREEIIRILKGGVRDD